MDGTEKVDEFVIGGLEKGKIGKSYDSKKKKPMTVVRLKEYEKVSRI